MRRKYGTWLGSTLAALGLALVASGAWAHSDEPHEAAPGGTPASAPVAPPPPNAVRLDERLGGHVSLENVFADQDGRRIQLREKLTLPTVVVPTLYKCRTSCPLELESVAKVLGKMDLVPGRDFRVLAVSFDPLETAEDAQAARRNYLKLAGEAFPPEAWDFLVGDADAVSRFLDEIGFRVYRRGPHDYVHPNAILTLGRDGKISRYLYGTTFLPFDLSLAVSEAARGITGLTATRMLSFCYTYDSSGRKYLLDVSKLSGAATLTVASGFILFLALGRKRPSRRS